MNLTYNIELITTDAEKAQIISFLQKQQEVINIINQSIFTDKPILSLKVIHQLNYDKLRKQFPTIPSQLIIKCEQEALQNYRTTKTNKNKSKLVNKHNLSLRLDKRLYSKFTQSSIRINIGTSKRVDFGLKLYPKAIDMFSKYKPCDPLLFVRDNRIFLSTTFEVTEVLPKDDSILGVDLGMRRLFTTSEGNALKSTEYLKQKRNIRYLKRILQAKNTKSAKRHKAKLKRKEHNFSKNYCQHMANTILKTDKSIIVMEDLTKIKTKKNKYQNINAKSQIPFYTLRTILTYKAPQKAKLVVTVNPSYTSQDDCRCLERGERKGCRYYAIDGKIFDADYNASINIANKYSEHPISFKLPLDGSLNLLGRLLSTSQS